MRISRRIRLLRLFEPKFALIRPSIHGGAGGTRDTKSMPMKPALLGAVMMTVLIDQAYPSVREADAGANASEVQNSFRAEFTQLQAPVGHRQPTQNDIPPSVRQEEAPNTGTAPQPGLQGSGGGGGALKENRRAPSPQPEGVPRICDPC
jgi:hypothetical protein